MNDGNLPSTVVMMLGYNPPDMVPLVVPAWQGILNSYDSISWEEEKLVFVKPNQQDTCAA